MMMMKKTLAMVGVIAVGVSGLIVMGPGSSDVAVAATGNAVFASGETHGGKQRGSWADLSGVDTSYKIEPNKNDPEGAYEFEKPAKFSGLSDTEMNYLYQHLSANDLSLVTRDQNVKSYPELTDVVTDPFPLGSRDNDIVVMDRKAALMASLFEWYSVDGSREGATWDKEYANQVVADARAFSAALGTGGITLKPDVVDGANGRDGGHNELGGRAQRGSTRVHVTNDAGQPIPYTLVRVDRGIWDDKTLHRADANGVVELSAIVRDPWYRTELTVSAIDPRPASIGECNLKVFRPTDDAALSKVITDNCGGSALTKAATAPIIFKSAISGENGRNGRVMLGEPVLRDVGCGRKELDQGVGSRYDRPYTWEKEDGDETYGLVKLVPRKGYMFDYWVDPSMADEERWVDVGPAPDGDCAIDLTTVQNMTEKPQRISVEGNPAVCTPFDSVPYSAIAPTISVPATPGIVYSVVDDAGYTVGLTYSPTGAEIELLWSAQRGSVFTVIAELAPGYVALDASVPLPTWTIDMGARPGFCAAPSLMGDPYLVRSETCGENLSVIRPPNMVDEPGASRVAPDAKFASIFMRDGADVGAMAAPMYPPTFFPDYNVYTNHVFSQTPWGAVTGPVNVTKIPGPMFMIPTTEQSSWDFDLSPLPCPGSDIEVRPASPERHQGPYCVEDPNAVPGAESDQRPFVRVAGQPGVQYHLTNPANSSTVVITPDIEFPLDWALTYTVTASALPGYVIPEGLETQWSITTIEKRICADMGVAPEVQAPASCGAGSTIKTVSFSDDFSPYTWEAEPAAALTTGATGTVKVHAVLKPGYAWKDRQQQTEWTFELPAIEPCDKIVTSESPTVVPAVSCGVGATVQLPYPAVEGIVYNYDKTQTEGIVVIKASTLPGYVFADGAATEWSLDLGQIEACPPIAYPIAPTLVDAEKCGEEAFVFPPLSPGIHWNQSREGRTVTVTATAQDGWVLDQASQSVWTFELPEIVPCDEIPVAPSDIVVSPIAPVLQDSGECAVPASVVITETEGATYNQVREGQSVTVTAVAQPGYVFEDGAVAEWVLTIPEPEPCAVPAAQLPFTGGELNLAVPIVGGLLLAAGLGIAVASRRKRNRVSN